MEFVGFDTARSARGLRLVVLAGVPSPWSQAALAILDYKGIAGIAYRRGTRDKEATEWTGVPNAPALLHDDDAVRTGWAEILILAERLAPEPSLIPDDGTERAMMFGLCHALMGEGGLVWNSRLCSVSASLVSEGTRGYPLPVAKYLGARYGYREGCAEAARKRLKDDLSAVQAQLERNRGPGAPYYFGPRITALDFYSSAVVDIFAPLAQEECPMHPIARAGFEWFAAEIADDLPAAMIEHRDMMHARHIPLPLPL